MENQELKHYIDTQLAGGTSPDELKKLLMHHGWAPEIVDAHMPPTVPVATALVEVGGIGAIDGGPYIDDRKKRKWAIFFLVLPFALLVLILTVYAVNSFAVSAALSDKQTTVAAPPGTAQGLGSAPALDHTLGLSLPTTTGLGQEDKRATTAKIVNVALSLLGLLAFLSIFICIPIGIVLLVRSRRTLKPGAAYDERSGKYEMSVIPPELGHWNWGAAFLTLWWGIYYRVWISLLIFVPVIGSFWWVVMGVKGNEWAWQKNKWLSVDEFNKAQKKWAVWAIALTVFSFLSAALVAWSMLAIFVGSHGVQQVRDTGVLHDDRMSDASAANQFIENGWKNTAYYVDGRMATLKGGDSALAPTGLVDNLSGEPVFGDLNGDGKDDVALILTEEPGGSGTFYYVTAALQAKNGTAAGLDAVLLGDRIVPVATTIEGGVITVKYLDRKPGEPFSAAPSVAVTRKFNVMYGGLIEIK